MEWHLADSINLETYTHDEVDDDSTLSIKIKSGKSVLITPSKNMKLYLSLEKNPSY